MMIMMKTSLWAGLVLSSPVILFELWSFVAPGLTDREKKALRPIFWVGVFFFLFGAFFCYFLVFPFTIEFLVWLDVLLGIKPWYTPDDTIGLLLTFMLLFGAIFELPLVAAVLARLGFLRISLLLRFWRYILVLCFFLGGILSPGGDVVSMLIMSLTLVFLYGLSVLLVWVCQRKAQTQPE
jgi:sec-independent protein translocase protein TatC